MAVELPSDIIGVISAQVDPCLDSDIELARQCSLVCHSFRDYFQPYAFKRINIMQNKNHRPALSRLLKCMDDNPRLAEYIEEVSLSTRSNSQSPTIPTLFKRLLSLSHFRFSFMGSALAGGWSGLDTDTQAAVMDICSLPTLRSLDFENVPDLPPEILFEANSKTTSLILARCSLFETDRTFPSQLPNLASLRHIYCSSMSSGGLVGSDWIYPVVETPASSGNLRTVKLIEDIRWWVGDGTPYDRSFNLANSVNLTSLTIASRIQVLGRDQNHTNMLFFKAFLGYLNKTLSTIPASAPLETLRFAYVAPFDQTRMSAQQFRGMDNWRRVWETVGSRASQRFRSLKTVEFDLGLAEHRSWLQRPFLVASLEQLVLEDAPDVTFRISFDPCLRPVFEARNFEQ